MDDIEKARVAREAAGFGVDALAQLIDRAEAMIASAERRSLPLAFGETIRTRDVNIKGTINKRVVKVGRTLIHLGEGHGARTYSLADGRMTNHWQGYIDPDDLFRIKRDLVGKRPPKPRVENSVVVEAPKVERS